MADTWNANIPQVGDYENKFPAQQQMQNRVLEATLSAEHQFPNTGKDGVHKFPVVTSEPTGYEGRLAIVANILKWFSNGTWRGVPTPATTVASGSNTPVVGTLPNFAREDHQHGSGVPAGAVMHFAMNAPPTGWLECNGSAVSRTTYSSLFSAIGTTFGTGDGSSTFNLPDLRGEFIRGWDDGRGIDAGRTFGSAQADGIKSHLHSVTNIQWVGSGGEIGVNAGGNQNVKELGTYSTASTGGAETRPRNIALLPCIKY